MFPASNVARKGECGMVGKKPAIIIGADFSVWVGNTQDTPMTLPAGELFGFGRGTYEQKEIRDALSENKQTINTNGCCLSCWWVFGCFVPCFT